MVSKESPLAPHSLEYVRRLYANVLDWDRNVETKAQIIFTIDGLFVSLLAGSLFGILAEVALVGEPRFGSVAVLSPLTWSFASLMTLCIGVSIYSSIRCLIPPLLRPNELAALHGRGSPNYGPNTMWFFQLVASLDRDEFVEETASVDADFERRALASQIHIISARALRKHRLVQRGFWFAALGFAFFVLSGGALAVEALSG